MTHVLVLCEFPTINGGENSLLTLLPELIDRGCQFTVAAPAGGPLETALRPLPVEFAECRWRDGEAALSLAQRQAEVRRLLQEFQPDLLHANSLSTSRISGPEAAECGVPSVGHIRDIVGLSSAAVADVNRHTTVVCVSQTTRRFHIDQGLAADRSEVVYNGVNLKRFAPRPAVGTLHDELGIPDDQPLIISIGQIILRKGLDVAMQAVLRLRKQGRAFQWLIVGERYSQKAEAIAHEEDLRRMARTPPLAGHVHFLGYRRDLPELLNEADILLHAARQEPLGRVLLEAAASGTAVVATDVGGTAEIFPPGDQAAELVPPDDPSQMSVAVGQLLDDAARRHSLGSAARRRAEAMFDHRRAAADLASVYVAAMQRCGKSPPIL